MLFTVFTKDYIGKNSKSNEATKHFHGWNICMFQCIKSVDDRIVRSYSHNSLLGTVADFFLSQPYTYIPPLLNPTKVANLFVIIWKPLLYQPWCSLIFNQIYMGSHLSCCQTFFRPWHGVTSLLSKLPYWIITWHSKIAINILPNFELWCNF